MIDDVNELLPARLAALHVLAVGIASRSTSTRNDPENGVRSVSGASANALIRLGLARDVPGWRAVEISEAGRALVTFTSR